MINSITITIKLENNFIKQNQLLQYALERFTTNNCSSTKQISSVHQCDTKRGIQITKTRNPKTFFLNMTTSITTQLKQTISMLS